jgi:hypothetical protein
MPFSAAQVEQVIQLLTEKSTRMARKNAVL